MNWIHTSKLSHPKKHRAIAVWSVDEELRNSEALENVSKEEE